MIICEHEERDAITGKPVFTVILEAEEYEQLESVMEQGGWSREDALASVIEHGLEAFEHEP